MPPDKIQKIIRVSLAAFFLAALFIAYMLVREDARGLRVTALDVGEGSAILIDAPSGDRVLVGTGPDRSILSALGRTMPFYDRTIDAVIVDAPDRAHTGGLGDVLADYRVGAVFASGAVAIRGAQTTAVAPGDTLDLGGGAALAVLSADASGNLVLRLTYGKTSFLLAGAATPAVERSLAREEGGALGSDVLVAPHFGSADTLVPEFFSAAAPSFAVLSFAADNRFGYPDPSVVSFLSGLGAVRSTADDGDIPFFSDGYAVHPR